MGDFYSYTVQSTMILFVVGVSANEGDKKSRYRIMSHEWWYLEKNDLDDK